MRNAGSNLRENLRKVVTCGVPSCYGKNAGREPQHSPCRKFHATFRGTITKVTPNWRLNTQLNCRRSSDDHSQGRQQISDEAQKTERIQPQPSHWSTFRDLSHDAVPQCYCLTRLHTRFALFAIHHLRLVSPPRSNCPLNNSIIKGKKLLSVRTNLSSGVK